MLSCIRRFARPLAALAVLAFIAPGAVVDCREISAVAGAVMTCCKPGGDGTGLRAECCAVGGEQRAPERPASTTASTRTVSDGLAASPAIPSFFGPPLALAIAASDLLDTGLPPDRLYIRFAVIRR